MYNKLGKWFVRLVLLLLISFCTCKKKDVNQIPTCSIVYPLDGIDIPKCELVKVSCLSNDPEGEIVEVKILVDNIDLHIETNKPNSFDWFWDSNNYTLGKHEIKAIVKDVGGAMASDVINVNLVENSPPQADFTSSLTSVTIYEPIQFTDLSLNNPINWLWEFGDGFTSSEKNPTHDYMNFGEFTITLTVSNACGSDVKSLTNYIIVERIMNIPCPGIPTVMDADGNVYNTVRIGNFCWMAKNLNVGVRINGDEDQMDNNIIEKYCYDNNNGNCNAYGGLYQWDEMMQYAPSDDGEIGTTQGICPDGWHIPTKFEWSILNQYLGENAGGKLKETGTTHWLFPNQGATNESGFSALPGGERNIENAFESIGEQGCFYSSEEYSPTYIDYYYLHFLSNSLDEGSYRREFGRSVRCVKFIGPDKRNINN